jgi:hypothetical protein
VIHASTVLAPVFVQALLTFVLLTWMGYLRVTAVRSGVVHPRDVALGQQNWPPFIMQVANAYKNQLELPVLFYAVVALALLTATATTAFVVLAWIFVAFRLAHVLIHVTTNRMSRRFFLFLGGAFVLFLMWLLLAGEILFGI